jgi:hypothetical protein
MIQIEMPDTFAADAPFWLCAHLAMAAMASPRLNDRVAPKFRPPELWRSGDLQFLQGRMVGDRRNDGCCDIIREDTASFIARHDPGVSRDHLLQVARRRVAGFDVWPESLRKGPGNLISFAREARELAGLFHLATPDAPEVLSFLQLMARAIAAEAARAIPGGGPVPLDLGKLAMIELAPTRQLPLPLLQPRYLADAYHAAFAAGDKPALALLADAPIELLARTPPSAEERAYMLPHALGLQRLAR